MNTNRLTGLGKTTRVVEMDDGATWVYYHSTPVVKIDATRKRITLSTGGWRTATTKTKMNQAARVFDLHYTVYQQDGTWWIHVNPEYVVNDGIHTELYMAHTQEITLR